MTGIIERRAAPATAADQALPVVAPAETLAVAPPETSASLAAKKRRLWDVMKVLPIAFYTPETSFGFGAGMLLLFDMPGALAERRPSSLALGGIYTLNSQMTAQVTPELRFGDDDYVLRLDMVGASFPNRFYGIGPNTSASVYDVFTDRYLRGEVEFRMRPFSRKSWLGNLYLGARYRAHWSGIRDEKSHDADDASVFDGMEDLGEKAQFASGMGPLIAYDSRDGINWPLGGSLVELKATFFDPVFGSTVRYQALSLDARHYLPLWLNHILAMRLLSQHVRGEVPFQHLPQLGGSGQFRGWFQGQLRDRNLIALEAEYRVPIRKRWAVVGFGSVGTVAPRLKDFKLGNVRAAFGAGLRFALDTENRTNIRLDVAYGDRPQFYLQFREAF